jgi:SAM-dependent methyltransferase
MVELPKAEYELMYSSEDSFWWYKGMREVTGVLFSRLGIMENENREILDLGCGTGYNLKILMSYGEAFGMELSDQALRFLALRKPENVVRADTCVLPFSDESFDLVCSFDVLEYIPEETLVLKEIFRVLRSRGLVFIRDAAFPWLKGEHDRSSGIQTRYTASMLSSCLSQAGFKVLFSTYANFLLFPAIAGSRILREHLLPHSQTSKSDIYRSPRFLNGFFSKVMILEALLHKRFRLPFGISVIVAGQKS